MTDFSIILKETDHDIKFSVRIFNAYLISTPLSRTSYDTLSILLPDLALGAFALNLKQPMAHTFSKLLTPIVQVHTTTS